MTQFLDQMIEDGKRLMPIVYASAQATKGRKMTAEEVSESGAHFAAFDVECILNSIANPISVFG